MKATSAEIEKSLTTLTKTPRRLAELSAGLDEAHLRFAPDKKSWSVSDNLAHLRACADVWAFSIYAMLAENEPVFSDINERKWAKAARYIDVPFKESLQVYSLQRENLIRVLKALPFESWERSAIIFERKHTVFTQTRRMALHEQEHWEQIEKLLK
ncbi:MAG TPA: DinB family protein [Anaerolineales bacterium]|jgi:hypothetical protein|nr:DinB family protein [Anaerolineales bacterium]